MNKFLLLLISLIFLSSCAPKLILNSAKPRLQQKEADLLYSKLADLNQNFGWLTGKIECDAKLSKQKASFGINFRLREDSMIWLSVTPALGIEVARMQMTLDSVFFINKLEKSYFTDDYQYLRGKLKLEELDYCVLQDILVGNPILLSDEDRWTGEIDSNFYVLKNIPAKKLRKVLGISRDEDFDLPADSVYLYEPVDPKMVKILRKTKDNERYVKRYFMDEEFTLKKLLITDVPSNRLLEVEYQEYQKVDNLYLPQKIHVSITDQNESITFDLLYTKVKTEEPAPVTFKIPEKYEFSIP